MRRHGIDRGRFARVGLSNGMITHFFSVMMSHAKGALAQVPSNWSRKHAQLGVATELISD